MNLIKATMYDFDRLSQFYRHVIAHTENMDIYARWVYGKHPTDEMIESYIQKGSMYFSEKDGSLISAVAVTPQAEDYHDSAWLVSFRSSKKRIVCMTFLNICKAVASLTSLK